MIVHVSFQRAYKLWDYFILLHIKNNSRSHNDRTHELQVHHKKVKAIIGECVYLTIECKMIQMYAQYKPETPDTLKHIAEVKAKFIYVFMSTFCLVRLVFSRFSLSSSILFPEQIYFFPISFVFVSFSLLRYLHLPLLLQLYVRDEVYGYLCFVAFASHIYFLSISS